MNGGCTLTRLLNRTAFARAYGVNAQPEDTGGEPLAASALVGAEMQGVALRSIRT